MKPGEVREKTEHELLNLSRELEEEIFKLRFQKGAGQLKQMAGIRRARHDLARVRTAMREREILKEKGQKT